MRANFVGISWLLLAASSLLSSVTAWDNDELEIFDLVEEINENFYKILNVEQVNYLIAYRVLLK